MTSESQKLAVLCLQLVSARAAKLASDLEAGRLWEGEYQQGLAEIGKALRDCPEERGR